MKKIILGIVLLLAVAYFAVGHYVRSIYHDAPVEVGQKLYNQFTVKERQFTPNMASCVALLDALKSSPDYLGSGKSDRTDHFSSEIIRLKSLKYEAHLCVVNTKSKNVVYYIASIDGSQ